MKVCILGIGRSGTTALYSLMQNIMESKFGEEIEYIYEPFLWNKEVFNGRLEPLRNKFRYMDSLSIEGMLHHQKLPMLIDGPVPYADNDYLNRLLSPDRPQKNLLIKLIRANGRYLLINRICPDCKNIFVMRNPIDVVNSVITKFSFYGGEFHKDDFPRFIREVNSYYQKGYSPEDFKHQVEKELFYWEYMNRFALNSFEKSERRPLIICHEEYIKKSDAFVDKICRFIGIEMDEHYIALSKKKIGRITKTFQISENELSMFMPYLIMYMDLLDKHQIEYDFQINDILSKYDIVNDQPDSLKSNNALYGYNIPHLRDKLNGEIKQRDEWIKQQDEWIKEIYNSKSYKLGNTILKPLSYFTKTSE
jgi:Sulfotransferase family